MLLRPTAVAFGLALLLGAWPAPALTPPAAAAPAQPVATTYAQLPSAARAAISRSVGRGQERFAATALVDGAALFQGSGFSARVAGSTMHISPEGGAGWSLAFAGWGRADSLLDPALGPVEADQNEATFRGGGIDAWWVHGPAGLEQGWTVRERPEGDGPLLLDLRSTGIASVEVDQDGRSATLIDVEGARHRYAGLWAADAEGRDVRATVSASIATLTITVDDAAAVYPITIDPWIEVAGLTRDAGSANNDRLGLSVAISADGATIAAGAPYDGTGGPNRGRVDVFVRPATGWTTNTVPAAKLTRAAGSADSDRLGTSVAISADGGTIAAGAHLDDTGGSDRGRVDVFVRSGGGWADSSVPTAKLTRAAGSLNADQLGWSVAISADGATIAAGAPGDDTGGADRGRVDVFVRPGGGWADSSVPTAKLTRAAGSTNDQLGYSVSISAAGATIAAGAPGDDTGGSNRGRVDVFVRPGGGWANSTVPNAKLTRAAGSADNDLLGQSVAISADGATIAAGARLDDTGGTDRGRVDVFVRPGSGWADSSVPSAKLTHATGSAENDQLGYSVAISADGATIATGAPLDNTGGSDRGRIDVFARPGGGWADSGQPESSLTRAAGAGHSDQLGFSVAISGDGRTVVAGVPFADDAGTDRGAIRVFLLGRGGWATSTAPSATATPAVADGNFGYSVAMTPDGATIAAAGSDAVTVFIRPAGGWAGAPTPVARLTKAGGDGLNYSVWTKAVAISAGGTTIVAGVPTADLGGTDRGRVYVWVRPAGGWVDDDTPNASLSRLAGSTNVDRLGFTVAIAADGETIAAGAIGDDSAGANFGRVDVWIRPGGGWADDDTPDAKLTSPVGGSLGWGLAMTQDGATIFAGLTGAEVVEVFVRPGGGWVGNITTPSATVSRPLVPTSATFWRFAHQIAVSADGGTLAVSATNWGGGVGLLAVYLRPAAGWANTNTPAATYPGGSFESRMGTGLTISSDGGAIAIDTEGFVGNPARVHVLVRPAGGWSSPLPPIRTLSLTGGYIEDGVAMTADGSTIVAGPFGRLQIFPMVLATDFAPTARQVGEAVTVYGGNFLSGNVTGVRFGAGPAAAPTFSSTSALLATVPAGSTSGNLFLDLAGGQPPIELPGFVLLQPGEVAIAGLTAVADLPINPGALGNFGANITAGTSVAYSWNFGDGSPPVAGKNVTHAYSAPGLYLAVVTATNAAGSATATATVVVAPNSDFTLLRVGSEALGQPNVFTAIVQVVGTATYSWNWGDGSPVETGQGLTHTYLNGGAYAITVTVTDSSGVRAFTRVVVVVATSEQGRIVHLPIVLVQSGYP